MDKFAPMRSAIRPVARRRPLPVAEIGGGEVLWRSPSQISHATPDAVHRAGRSRARGGRVERGAYLARFMTILILSPFNAVVVYFSSSAVSEVIVRFCSLPTWFGSVLASRRNMMTLSASLTVYVPK